MKIPAGLKKEVAGLPVFVWIGLLAAGVAIGLYLRSRNAAAEGLTAEELQGEATVFPDDPGFGSPEDAYDVLRESVDNSSLDLLEAIRLAVDELKLGQQRTDRRVDLLKKKTTHCPPGWRYDKKLKRCVRIHHPGRARKRKSLTGGGDVEKIGTPTSFQIPRTPILLPTRPEYPTRNWSPPPLQTRDPRTGEPVERRWTI